MCAAGEGWAGCRKHQHEEDERAAAHVAGACPAVAENASGGRYISTLVHRNRMVRCTGVPCSAALTARPSTSRRRWQAACVGVMCVGLDAACPQEWMAIQ